MKTSFLRLAFLSPGLLAILGASLDASPGGQPVPPAAETGRPVPESVPKTSPETGLLIPAAPLPRFDLDFPGGTPAELVAAIEKAGGYPINVIVPNEYARIPLPALKLRQVNLRQLFQVFGSATKHTLRMDKGLYEQSCMFVTNDRDPSLSSIWYFRVEGYYPAEQTTRFFSLAPYLRDGLTVDDITTAIRTGWEMRGERELPTLKFHQETQILIAVGDPAQLAVIGDVLEATAKTLAVRETAAAVSPKTP